MSKLKEFLMAAVPVAALFVVLLSMLIASRRGAEPRRAAPAAEPETVSAEVLAAAPEVQAEELLADGTSLAQARTEAEWAARVVYATARDNSRAGQKLTVWCFICRMASRGYPNDAQAVAEQAGQWMGWQDDLPVLRQLVDLAYEEIAYWHDGGYLPMSKDYVFLSWEPGEITLRDRFEGTGNCHWFYESDWEVFEAARAGAAA